MTILRTCAAALALTLLSACYVGPAYPPGWHHGWHRGYYGGHSGWYDEGGGWRGEYRGGGWYR